MRHILFHMGGLSVASAPVFAGLAGLAAFLFVRAHREKAGLDEEKFWELVLALVAGVLSGAVLSYIFIYKGGPLHNLGVIIARKRLPGGSFWGVLWTSAAAAWAYCRARKLDFPPVADVLGLSSLLGLSIMRIGCFLHGCCHGAPTDLPWGVTFNDPFCAVRKTMLGVPLHPTQLYELAGSLVIFLAVYYRVYRKPSFAPGTSFTMSVLAYSALRFAADFSRPMDAGPLAFGPFTTGQTLALLSAAGVHIWRRRK